MSPAFDCVICGTCVADVLVRPVPLTAPIGDGRLFAVEPIEATTGGIVCNTGVAMRRLGMRVAAASLVGDDLWGSLVRSRLEGEGIDAAGVGTASAATSTTAVLIDPAGERSFAHHVGACAAIDLAFIRDRLDLFARGRTALVGYLGLLPGLEPQLAEVVGLLAGAGCRVALETAGSGGDLAALAPALPHVDLYVPSLDEAVRQTGRDFPAEILACYREHGATGLVGVKLGSRGVVLSPAAGDLLEIPCVEPPGPVADTTGAGDSFLAGLLTGLANGMPIGEAGLLGAATAACCVTGVGATAGLRSFADTWRLVRD
jgi:sugar/nucleoside kinase (ribokinase family)